MKTNIHIEKAISISGGLVNFSKRLGEKYQNIQKWLIRGQPPFKKIKAIEQATNGAVMRHEFFPEIFEGYEPVNVHYSDKESVNNENE